jgi:YfiH family protein
MASQNLIQRSQGRMTYRAANLGAMQAVEHGFGVVNDPRRRSVLICPEQQHAGNVVIIRDDGIGPFQADALFSYGYASIGVVTADCVPTLVASTQVPVVGAIHAGWKGIVSGIVENSLAALVNEGVETDSLRLAIGPCIGRCCYEISQSTLALIEETHGTHWDVATRPWHLLQPTQSANCMRPAAQARNGLIWLDLVSYIRQILRVSGIRDEQVEVVDVCTYCGSEKLGSYRRRQHFELPRAFQYSWISNRLS